MKHYFLGSAANYSGKRLIKHTFAVGREKDCGALQRFLAKRYNGKAILTKNGRSALNLALKSYLQPGDGVIVNGFTCYAVYEAVKTAGLVPVWADITGVDLNYNIKALEDAVSKNTGVKIRGIIVQNSLGNPVDMVAIEKFAKIHSLVIIEDLAHCTGVKYPDGREAGTIGAAAALSFGKDKSIDTISGGAVVLRDPCNTIIKAPNKAPKISDTLRARFYPLFGAVSRGLSYVRLGGIWMRVLVKIHWVEKSADNRLDTSRKIAKFQAKLALGQLKELKKSGEPPIREYYLVRDRAKVLERLRRSGYYFDGFWYERPVSPKRYYKKVHFPEEKCPVAVDIAKKVINMPTHYNKKDLEPARNIIAEYEEEK